jgi:ArsR family transcriptional regulator
LQNLLQSYKASVFQALSHPTRIAILELLREGELSAGKLQERLGIEQANLSQHLAILRSRQLVVNRKEGNQVFYSAKSPVLLDILDILRQHFQANLAEAIQILETTEAATATMSQKTLPASEAAFLKATERDR